MIGWFHGLARARRRRRLRLLYEEEISQRHRELVVVYQKDQFMEALFIEKQEKINRLIEALSVIELLPQHQGTAKALGLIPTDLRREKVISSLDQMVSAYAADFHRRQMKYEQTGKLDSQEEALTGDSPTEQGDHNAEPSDQGPT